MPTIPNLQEQNSAYPSAPPSTDINPQRFGKDAAAMAEFGGQVSRFGNQLVQKRKHAEDADAVSNALVSDTIEFSKMENEARQAGPGPVNRGWSVRGEQPISRADDLYKKMQGRYNSQLSSMPSEEAKRKYSFAVEQDMAQTYANNIKWENREKLEQYHAGIDQRGTMLSQESYQNPNFDRAANSLRVLREDLNGHVGSTIDEASASKLYSKYGGDIAKSYIGGLAESSIEMSPTRRAIVLSEAREKLRNLPPEFSGLLDGNDLRILGNQIDSAERAGVQNDNYREALGKKALQESRDKEQNKILEDIYEGKGSVKSILKSNLDPDKKQTMLNVLKARLDEPNIPSQDALHGVFQRIHAEPSDPKRITSDDQLLKEFTKGKLTLTQLKQARTELGSLGTVQGQVEGDMKKHLMRQAEAALAKPNSMGMVDPDGQENMAKFNSYVIGEIEAQKRSGKPVRELLDANSPNYLGKAITNYKKTPQQIMKSTVERMKTQKRADTQASKYSEWDNIRDQFGSLKDKLTTEVQRMTNTSGDNGFSERYNKKSIPVIPPPKGTVPMLDPSGRRGYVPEEDVKKALAQGYKLPDAKVNK